MFVWTLSKFNWIASPTESANTREKHTGHRSINAPYHVFVLAEGIRSSTTQHTSAEDDSSVCHVFLRQRQSDNLSVDDSRSTQNLSLLLSIILGSVVKTTSLQVTAKTMKTLLCAHQVQRRSCPSIKAVICVTLSLYAVEHNAVGKNTTNSDLGGHSKSFPQSPLHKR